MRVFVTGAAGFIGSHYVRTLLSGGYPGFEDAEVTVFDKLTYAGNLDNLAPVADNPRYRFVQGDICDARPARRGAAGPRRRSSTSPPRPTSTARSPAPPTSSSPTCSARRRCSTPALRTDIPRVVHVSTDEVYGTIPEGSWTEEHLLEPNSPYSRGQGRRRPDRPLLRAHLRAERLGHPLHQQLRAVPVPGEGHPAVRHQPARRQERCRCTATGSTSATGCTSTTTAAASSWCWRRARRRDLQHRRRHRADQQGADRAAARRVRRRLGRVVLRRGPQGSRPALLAGRRASCARMGYAPQTTFEDGLAATVQWYRDNESWWRAAQGEGGAAR